MCTATEKSSRSALVALVQWPKDTLRILDPDPDRAMLGCVVGLIPHLLTSMGRDDSIHIAKMVRVLAVAWQWHEAGD